MIRLFVELIKLGSKTLEEVPKNIREAVRKRLEEEN